MSLATQAAFAPAHVGSKHSSMKGTRVVAAAPMRAAAQRAVKVTAMSGTNEPLALDPTVSFFMVRAMIRPWRLEKVVLSLNAAGIRGLTTYPVKGSGVQSGSAERYAGTEFNMGNLVEKMCVEVVVVRDQVQDVVDTIIDASQTGEIGDGKIFITPVADVIRVRTGEVGKAAEKMAGGRSDILQKDNSVKEA